MLKLWSFVSILQFSYFILGRVLTPVEERYLKVDSFVISFAMFFCHFCLYLACIFLF